MRPADADEDDERGLGVRDTDDSLLVTEEGFLRFDELYESDEEDSRRQRRTTDRLDSHHRLPQGTAMSLQFASERDADLTIEGALKHRVQLADGTLGVPTRHRSSETRFGLSCGTNVWPRSKQPLEIHGRPAERVL